MMVLRIMKIPQMMILMVFNFDSLFCLAFDCSQSRFITKQLPLALIS